MDEIVVGIDVGTTKVCTLVGRVESEKTARIIGVGIEPSDGIRKGVIVDLGAATQAITRSVEKAEQTSGLEITAALVSLAGGHVSSINSRGAVAVPGGVIDATDISRALDQARTTARWCTSSNGDSAWMGRKAYERRWACTVTTWRRRHTSSPPRRRRWTT